MSPRLLRTRRLPLLVSHSSLHGRPRAFGRRGFTLVELMIVVAIIGILAALAIYGVERYIANSKAAEAKQHVGAISRGASAAFERTFLNSDSLAEANQSTVEEHTLCDDAVSVPATPPQGRKYQPSTAPATDFEGGTPTVGWQCLRFRITQPIHYQYNYNRNGPAVALLNPTICTNDCYEATAAGDLNGDGVDFSYVSRTGKINPLTGSLLATTYLYVQDEAQ